MGFIPVEQGGIQTKLLICKIITPSRGWNELICRISVAASGSDLHALATNGGLSEFEYSSRAWQMAS